MQKWILFLILFQTQLFAKAQVQQTASDERRKPTKQEVKLLAHMADSFLTELELLYKLEVKENNPRKYQPERIALVRSYLLVFQNIENGCSIIAYSPTDISQIFGKPDTIVSNSKTETQWLYGKLQTQFISINNLRYRFYFKNNKLNAVKRDDK
jgi:hypothetical protein